MTCSLVLPAPGQWYQGFVVVDMLRCQVDGLEAPPLGARIVTA